MIKQPKQSFGPQWGPKQFKKSQHPLAVIVSDMHNGLVLNVLRCIIIQAGFLIG